MQVGYRSLDLAAYGKRHVIGARHAGNNRYEIAGAHLSVWAYVSHEFHH